MSRLLHAAARGARIEYRFGENDQRYYESALLTLSSHYRIKPTDEAKQYGPISSMIREVALTDKESSELLPYIDVRLVMDPGWDMPAKDDRRVFLLILAEFLADEGL